VHGASVNAKLHIIHSTPTSFRAEDCSDSRFFIEGSVRAGGILSFLVVAQLRDGTRGTVSGAEFFEAMWTALASQVTVIEAEWSATNPDWVTNLNAFNDAILRGASDEVAATQTPTGKYATRKMYTRVAIIRALPAGARGQYQDVLVHFTK
jgi:hypothetical protein